MKGWTEERRKKQAEIIRQTRPWEKSTGPKTAEGKARSSMNAYKHGGSSATVKEIREALYYHQLFMRRMVKYLCAADTMRDYLQRTAPSKNGGGAAIRTEDKSEENQSGGA